MSLEFFQHPPAGFTLWPPLGLAALVFFATFILEDAAAVGAGLLLAAGLLSGPLAFAACFLGIWFGDIGLYGFARIAGRNAFERTSLRRFSPRIVQSERWFAERGSAILISSRVIPGARLPTYLAAGFLRLPFKQFLVVTGAAALFWTAGVLLLAQIVGARLLDWLGAFHKSGWILLAAFPVLLVVLHWFKKYFPFQRLNHFGIKLARWRLWEFWPPWIFYPPVGIYCLWLALKYRGLTLPTAANPGIFSGGMIGESKMATLSQLMAACPEFTAEAELLAGKTFEDRLASLRDICARRNFSHPFILKPDVGQRGAGIKLIRNEIQARDCLQQIRAPLLVQKYAEGPQEAGVFYYRHPGEKRGQIFAITEKIFPVVIGDGKSTVAELVWSDPRARFVANKYLQRFATRQNEILPAGQALKLVEAGNHAQGCIFRDGMHLCTPALVERMDAISQSLDGFFIGRYDLRFKNEDDLRAGKHFQIIELNGASSEATSIYDSRNSLLNAYRTLFRQWDLVFAIGAENRRRGSTPMKISSCWRAWRDYSQLAATYPAAD